MRYPIVCALFRFPRCAIKKRQHHLKIGGRNVERWPQVDNIAQRTDEEAEFLRSLADSPSPPGAARFAPRPMPCPPVERRPRSLYVTRI